MNSKQISLTGRFAGVVMGIGFALSASAGTPSLSAQQTFATGAYPYAIATADFNGDGLPDMVVTNDGDGTVTVLLNTTPANAASPTYSAGVSFPAGSHPETVAVADVNGDGLPDIITGNSGDGTISILLNTTAPGATTPSFAAPQVLPVGIWSASVIAMDVNGDGSPDLVVADYASETITVLLNATAPGSSTVDFSNQTTLNASMAAYQLMAADVNGDGLPDIVAVNYGVGTITVLLNTTVPGSTTPSFAPQQDFAVGGEGASISLVVTDLNGDGTPDVAVVNSVAGTVAVLANTTPTGSAAVSFAAPQQFPIGGNGMYVVAADLDGDGKPDLVVTNNSDNTISVLHNTTATGSATMNFDPQQTYATGANPVWLAATDVNGDGKLDIIVANNSDMSVSVLLNNTP